MARVLLLPHAPTVGLAHLGACLTLGHELRGRGHEVAVAYGGSRQELLDREGLTWHPVPEVAADREWHPGGWFASVSQLRSLVDAHLDLLERVRPDVAVSSSGIGGRLACEVAGVPQVHLMHYLATTPYGNRPVMWGNRLRDVRHPRRLGKVVRSRIRLVRRRKKGSSTLRVVPAARRQLGLPELGPAGFAGARDSIVAITTAPFLEPARGLPDNWRYVGPLTWSAVAEGAQLPHPGSERPLVYITQGSTGDPGLLRRAVSELASEDLEIVVTTGGLCDTAELSRLGPNVMAADLLPGAECLKRADVAIIHGGHLTFCQALLAGTPVAVMPYRGDQMRRVHIAERLGVGVGIWPPPLWRGAIRRKIWRLLETPSYGRRSAELASRLREGWDGTRNAAHLVEGVMADRPASEGPGLAVSLSPGARH